MALILNDTDMRIMLIAYDHKGDKMEQYAPVIHPKQVRYVNHDHLNGSDHFWICAFEYIDEIPDRIFVYDKRQPYPSNVTFGKTDERWRIHEGDVLAAAWLSASTCIKLEDGHTGEYLGLAFRSWSDWKEGERHGW